GGVAAVIEAKTAAPRSTLRSEVRGEEGLAIPPVPADKRRPELQGRVLPVPGVQGIGIPAAVAEQVEQE
ncbi:MAG: hypothetical protein EBU81_06070, partial [Proteobacteria bacterium]|nr:hypothetical protein [Pseudomonadota bacterium]